MKAQPGNCLNWQRRENAAIRHLSSSLFPFTAAEPTMDQENLSKLLKDHPQLHVLPGNHQVKSLLTIIRDRETSREDFIFYSDRLIRLVIEEGLSYLPFNELSVETPTQAIYKGVTFSSKICGVSIVRAGESMENGLRQVCKSIRIGKILIQRNETTAEPELLYVKLPTDIKDRSVLLLDPMLATGGSVCKAVEALLEAGVKEDKIIFLNLLAAPEGVRTLTAKHPKVTIVTAEVDQCLNAKKFIIPGIGDFGDRYFGTTESTGKLSHSQVNVTITPE